MSRISDAFNDGKAFIPFITGGDPDIETTEKLILGMTEAGADIIEIGIPFSDPVAEGPVIQKADERALSGGLTTDDLFAMVYRVRQRIQTPLVFMTYINPVFAYGAEKFMDNCKDAGIDGIIVPDMPFDEKAEIAELCSAYDVELLSMIAPTSDERIQEIARDSQGFLYCVSSLGVTGVRSEITTDVGEMVRLAKEVCDTPCAIGFGISTPEQAQEMAHYADGVIVGSAIVKLCAEYGRDCITPVVDYVRTMKQAL